jgi:Dr1-associated corepressor
VSLQSPPRGGPKPYAYQIPQQQHQHPQPYQIQNQSYVTLSPQQRFSQPHPYSQQVKQEEILVLPYSAPQAFSQPLYAADDMSGRNKRTAAKTEGENGGGQGPSLGIEVKTKFPVARIKRIMQADEEVGKVAQVTPVAVCISPSLPPYPSISMSIRPTLSKLQYPRT